MKLISLHLRNFRQHADSTVHFPASGLTGIIGTNESGKSTILEGIAWALYGSDAARGTKAGLRWFRAPARRQAEAELVFELGGRRYRLERKESDAKLFEGTSADPICHGTAAVNERIPRLIGMTLAEFRATYMCGQKDLTRIAAMLPTERETFFREVMGIGRIDRALKACRDRKNELAREREGLAAGLGEREPLEQESAGAFSQLGACSAALAIAERTSQELRKADTASAAALAASRERQARHNQAREKLKAADERATAARGEVERARYAVEIAEENRSGLAEKEAQLEVLPGLRQERETLRAVAAAASERETLRDTIKNATQDIAQYSEQLTTAKGAIARFDAGTLAKVKGEYREAAAALQAAQGERTARGATAKAEWEAAEAECQRLEAQIDEIRALGPDGPCPTCTEALGKHFDRVVTGLLQQMADAAERGARVSQGMVDAIHPTEAERTLELSLQDLERRGTLLREDQVRATQASQALPSIERSLQLAEERVTAAAARLAGIPDGMPDPERLAQLDREIPRLEQLDRSLSELRTRVAQIPLLEENLLRTQQAVTAADEAGATARLALQLAEFDAVAHTELEQQAQETSEARAQAEQAHARAEEQLHAAGDRRDRAAAALARYDARAEKLGTLTEALRIHELAAERLDDFRHAQAAGIRPELEELTTGFVSLLTDGRHDVVTITEDFRAELHEAGVALEVISGGTEDIAALALRLAVSRMIAERAGHPLSLLILDEPFGSLDEVRRANVLALIRKLADVFEQVILISHVDETKYASDHVIEVEYDEAAGCSHVRCAAPAGTATPNQAAA
jgi:exonuclease SbcC